MRGGTGTGTAPVDRIERDERDKTDETAAGQPRTRTSDGRSSEQRSTEEQVFEQAAAQLRPAWASGQARQQPVTPVGSPTGKAPISGTTPLPPESTQASAARAHGDEPRPSTSPAPASPVAPALPWVTQAGDLPSAQLAAAAPALRSHVEPAPATTPDTGWPSSTIELSDQIHEPDSVLDDQPVFAAAHSNFPAPPFATGVTQSPQFGRRSGSDETGDFSFARPKRRVNVRLLAIGAAACLALASVWALASGDSDDGATARTPPAAPTSVPPPSATPAAATRLPAPAAVAPAELPMGRELPKSLAPAQPRDGVATGTKRAAVSSPASGTSKTALQPRKAVTRPAPVSAKAVKAPAKPVAKSAPAAKSSKPPASALKAKPQPKAGKPGKPGKRVRLSTDVLDPWDK